MARVKINLPTQGESWFFIDPTQTVQDFIKEVQGEDSNINSLEIMTGSSTNPKPATANENLYKVLQDPYTSHFLKLNNMMYSFGDKSLRKDTISLKETSTWFTQCQKAGLPDLHSSTVATLLKNIETNLDFTPAAADAVVDEAAAETATPAKKAKKTTAKSKAAAGSVTVDQVCDTFLSQTQFFENNIIREQVFQLRAIKLMAQNDFDELDAEKQKIEIAEKKKHTLRVYAMTGFFTFQFLIGYHAIFNVGWLGWDLVEPITYSVGQGSFILGLWIILRNRGANVEYSDLEALYCEKKQRLWLEKYNFDLKRHSFLEKKLERLDAKLKEVEHRRFY